MVYLVLMFVSAGVAIAGALLTGDVPAAAAALGVLALCCLILALGHDAIPTPGQKRRKHAQALAMARFEAASHAASLEMVDRAGRRPLTADERAFMEAHR